MILLCPRCGYTWEYRGRLRLATCPSCLGKVSTTRQVDEETTEALLRRALERAEVLKKYEGWTVVEVRVTESEQVELTLKHPETGEREDLLI